MRRSRLGFYFDRAAEQACALLLGAGSRLTRAPAPVLVETRVVNVGRRPARRAGEAWGSTAGSPAVMTGASELSHSRSFRGRE